MQHVCQGRWLEVSLADPPMRPDTVDERTASYYTQFAGEIAQRYDSVESEMLALLNRAFAKGMRVLDVGAGSGRDVALLLAMGCDAYGVEPCAELREAAERQHPGLAGRLASNALPQLGQPFGGQFDGVLCSAVLMHLEKAQMLDAALAFRSILKEGGRLLLSLPLERPGLDAQHRDAHGRLFTPLPPDYLQLLFERVGFSLLERWESADSLGREGHSWCTFLFQVRHPSGARPLDLIEGILNRDRKTATYKLALFRALSEIATTEFEQARFVAEGMVGIPIKLVSEKWLQYYWPLFESDDFIPQIRGENPACAKPIAFRSLLSALIGTYRQSGGLTRFELDSRAATLPGEIGSLRDQVLNQIRNTIVQGPVTHAGGSLEAGRVFRYDPRSREILLSAALWREFCLVGHWIHDAVILRWAELTSDISKKHIKASATIDLLLTIPIPERDVADARSTYRQLATLYCTWTGAALPKGFAVDHIIPFSLWHNNDLWNLVPASP
ncbi:MAG: methyltransferase domain-containing protein, partial [Planctomycetes bacterium]|nr:methyltransferase domain-containing protein [Planctomycetota bacterium]